MKKGYVFLIISLFLLSACSTIANQTPTPLESIPAISETPVAETETTSSQPNCNFIIDNKLNKDAVMEAYKLNQIKTAQSIAQLYVDSIKEGVDLANDEDAIEMFDLLFDRQTLTVGDVSSEENMEDGYICDISGSGPKGDREVPLLLVFQDDNPRYFCPLAYYGKQSRRSVDIYLQYLSEGDAAKLSQWLCIDSEGDEYIDQSTELIEFYSQYNLSSAEVIDFDYNPDKHRFIYTVKDAGDVRFEIFMSYGDGFSMPDTNYILEQIGN